MFSFTNAKHFFLKFFLYHHYSELPLHWDEVVAVENILLSVSYFKALTQSSPTNLEHKYVGFFKEDELIGGAYIQKLDFNMHKSFYEKDNFYSKIKNCIVKQFAKNIVVVGNNMLTGQNGFYFNLEKIDQMEAAKLTYKAMVELSSSIQPFRLMILKDYNNFIATHVEQEFAKPLFKFKVQPAMILKIPKEWIAFEDYIHSFSKKYRARVRTAFKKSEDIIFKELFLDEVLKNSKIIHTLYLNIANHAGFNTFFLPENHFGVLKKQMGDHFKIFGYFIDGKLIGFFSLFINNREVDTYFLGYDDTIQKEKQLYLRMLLDMVKFSIDNAYSRINFGRTALEIKSTIGAKPFELNSFMLHTQPLIHWGLPKIFKAINPKNKWQQRHPFKN